MKYDQLQGQWKIEGNDSPCGVFQTGKVLMLIDPEGKISIGHVTGGSSIEIVNGTSLPTKTKGRISGGAQVWVITWDNGQQWSRPRPHADA